MIPILHPGSRALTMMIASAIMAATFAQNAQGFFLDEAAAKTGAVCLDGTPGAYYLSPGSGDGASKWYIHHQGKCVDARSHSLSLSHAAGSLALFSPLMSSFALISQAEVGAARLLIALAAASLL